MSAPASKPAKFGWTVIRATFIRDRLVGRQRPFIVYQRDCPADAEHHAADLAPFTHPSRAKAVAAGERGEFAYKQ
jgi:hypothetical protein